MDESRFPEFAEWGRQGGKVRAKKLSSKRRKEIAMMGVRARRKMKKRLARGTD